MEHILKNLKSYNLVANGIQALKALANVLPPEVDTLAEISPSANAQLNETEINLTEKIQCYEADLICNALLAVNRTQRQAAKILGKKNTTNTANPGKGFAFEQRQVARYVRQAKAQRLYRGFEGVLSKRLSNNYYYSANYIYSRLEGNYSGLADSDSGGRTSPDVQRFTTRNNFCED